MSEELNADKQAEGLPRSQVIGLILGAAFLLATIILPPPETMAAEAWAALGLMLLMATWWSTEAIPIPATALLPIVLVPALGLGTVGEATEPYANPIIFLFLGGGLHTRACDAAMEPASPDRPDDAEGRWQ